jgi:chromosome segregation ATPase
MVELIPTILGVIVVLLAFYAVITRKNWLEAKALLADTTIRYEAALQQTQKSEQGTKAQKDLIEKLRLQAQKAERAADEVKNRSSDGKLEIVRLKTEYDQSFKKLESNREHLLEQVTVLTQQLSEAVREKKIYSEELSTLTRETEKMGQAMSESLRNQLGEVKNELAVAKRERSNAQAALEKFKTESGLVKPEELKRWQAKVARLEQLYASMKGLREMAEERNENWETALRFFAVHILGQSQTGSGDQNIGALVGEALEKIGATLVDDDAEAAPYTLADKASPSQAEQLS